MTSIVGVGIEASVVTINELSLQSLSGIYFHHFSFFVSIIIILLILIFCLVANQDDCVSIPCATKSGFNVYGIFYDTRSNGSVTNILLFYIILSILSFKLLYCFVVWYLIKDKYRNKRNKSRKCRKINQLTSAGLSPGRICFCLVYCF